MVSVPTLSVWSCFSSAQPNLQVGATKKLVPLKAKEGPRPAHPRLAFAPPQLTPKPKTVSELLREKRLREWKAKRALPKRVILAPQLLLPPSVLIQPPAPAGPCSLPTPANSPSLLPSCSPAGAPTPPPGSSGQGSWALSQEPVGGTEGSRGKGASAGSKEGVLRKDSRGAPKQPPLPSQGLAAKPPTLVASPNPTRMGPGAKKTPHLASAACALGPAGSQQRSVKLVPPLVALPPSSHQATPQILPVTWLLTAQGLVPVTVVSLPSPGQASATSSPAVSPGLGQAAEASPGSAGPVAAGQPLPGAFASGLRGDGRPDPALPPAPLAPAVSTALPPTCPLLLPLPGASVGSVQSSAQEAPNCAMRNSHHPAVPQGTRAPPEKACPPPPLLQEEKATPDYSLLSLEEVAAVKEWAKGGSGPRAPSLETSLPYLPPFLCSLKTLSALLLNKAALEQTAACLVTPEGHQETRQQLDLEALREVVHQRLRQNPAYQLLKARFLAAFAVPAALAVLPPPRMTTTLSGDRWWEGSHRGDSSTSASSPSEDEKDHREAGRMAETPEVKFTSKVHIFFCLQRFQVKGR